MALKARRAVILAKTEAVYGVDAVPTGADAFKVSNLQVSPMEASVQERDVIRPYFGQSERLMSEIFSKVSFDIELAGHGGGVVGAMPKLDRLFKASGASGAQQTIPVVGITRVGTTATATVGAHTYKVGEKVKISGAAQAEYNGVKVITAVTATTYDFEVAGAPVTPATGVIIQDSAYKYLPISEGITSLTIDYILDGLLHKLTGTRGTISIEVPVKGIPKIKFDGTALNNAPQDVVTPIIVTDEFTIPQVANTQNTTGYELLGYAGALESLSLAFNNVVNYITLIGKEYVDILDRKVSGSLSFEATTVAQKDYFSAAKNQVTGNLKLTHGSVNGNKVSINCPRVMLDSPKYKEANGVMMMTANVSVMPVNGNDEIEISFK